MFTPGAALTEGDPRGSARVSQGILVTGPPEVSRPLLLSIPPPPAHLLPQIHQGAVPVYPVLLL